MKDDFMIERVEIKNFAIIDELSVEFDKGLNIITGETGAGKSVIVESLAFLFGSRFSFKELKKPVHVKASFKNEKERFLIERIYETSGKSKYYVNGKQVNFTDVEKLRQIFIDFHSQMDNIILTKNDFQLSLLDRYAGNDDKVSRYTSLFEERQNLLRRLQAMNMSEAERQRLIEIRKFQIDEIENAHLKEGEDLIIEEKINNYKNISKIHNLLKEINLIVDGENGIAELVSKALRRSEELGRYSLDFNSIYESILRLDDEVKALSENISNKITSYNIEENIDALIEKDELIKSLKRKHSAGDIKDLLEILAKYKKELDELLSYTENRQDIEGKIAEIENEMERLSLELSKKRKKEAEKLSERITSILWELDLKNAQFDIAVEDSEEFNSKGKNYVEFLFRSAPDLPLRPVRYVASGGEISRIMVSIKSVFSKSFLLSVMILDEIDSGVGGNTAFKIGRLIKDISKNSQVICITHLPQIAVFADLHIKVEKKIEKTHTVVRVLKLKDTKERADELARMFGSEYSPDTAYAHALELLQKFSI